MIYLDTCYILKCYRRSMARPESANSFRSRLSDLSGARTSRVRHRRSSSLASRPADARGNGRRAAGLRQRLRRRLLAMAPNDGRRHDFGTYKFSDAAVGRLPSLGRRTPSGLCSALRLHRGFQQRQPFAACSGRVWDHWQECDPRSTNLFGNALNRRSGEVSDKVILEANAQIGADCSGCKPASVAGAKLGAEG